MSTLNLLIFLFPLAYSPGPGNLFFAAIGARAGWRAAGPAFAGYHAATFLAALATGAGLLALAGPMTIDGLRYAGAAYMLWLARALWRAGAPQASMATRARATDGAALLALNPKAWAIMAALYAQYPGADTTTITQVAAIFTLNNALAFALWTVAGQWLLGQPHHARAANRIMALILCGAAVGIALG